VNSKINASRRAAAAVLAAAALCATGTAVAESTTVKGKGTYFVQRELLPLANGAAALHITATTVVSAEPSESGIMFGECAGLAYLEQDASYRSRIYCNFTENGTDSFAIQGDMDKAGGKIAVIGGSGRFKDATGDGKLTALGEEGGKGRYSYEFTISTP
jgi:hypothetical protein